MIARSRLNLRLCMRQIAAICAKSGQFGAGFIILDHAFWQGVAMKNAENVMSVPESITEYDISCTDEVGEVFQTGTFHADSKISIDDVGKFWIENFLNAAKGNIKVEMKTSKETKVFDYNPAVGFQKPKKERKRRARGMTEAEFKAFTDKYGVFIDEIDLSDEALDPNNKDEVVDALFEALNDNTKPVDYKVNCISDFTGRSMCNDHIWAASSMSPVDVLNFWLENNREKLSGDCVATISVKGKERARINYEAPAI